MPRKWVPISRALIRETARAFGMRTAFVARLMEFGPSANPDVAPEPWLDLNVDSFVALADALHA